MHRPTAATATTVIAATQATGRVASCLPKRRHCRDSVHLEATAGIDGVSVDGIIVDDSLGRIKELRRRAAEGDTAAERAGAVAWHFGRGWNGAASRAARRMDGG
jgi:hypothetical protein